MSIKPEDFGKTLSALASAQQSANDFRAQVEAAHTELGPLERIQALLEDLYCMLRMQFDVRPNDCLAELREVRRVIKEKNQDEKSMGPGH